MSLKEIWVEERENLVAELIEKDRMSETMADLVADRMTDVIDQRTAERYALTVRRP